MLAFIRSDLAQLTAYTPHPGSAVVGQDAAHALEMPEMMDQLDTNESPFDWPDDLKQKLVWHYQHHIANNRYPDGGHGALKQAIADYVNETAPGATISADQVSVGNGSDELIRSILIATCLGNAGSILVAEPTFSMYGILARTLGIPVMTVGRSTTNFEMDLTAAQTAIANTQQPPIRVVFVVHPNSPTGNALTAAELDWLRSLPENILVVIDEAYFEFSQQTLVGELAQHPNWIVFRTFSKAFRLAAHRVGYAIAHPELIAALEKTRLPYNLPSLSQTAALLALTHRALLLEALPLIWQERDRLLNTLRQESALQVWESAANFLFVRLAQPEQHAPDTLAHLVQTLKSQGTLIRHVSQGLRLTIGSPAENQRMLSRLQTLLKTLA